MASLSGFHNKLRKRAKVHTRPATCLGVSVNGPHLVDVRAVVFSVGRSEFWMTQTLLNIYNRGVRERVRKKFKIKCLFIGQGEVE